MSDVGIAPAPAPAPAPSPAPAPQATEVPISTNQTSTPTPIGPQTPDAPPGHDRRETIKRAMEKADLNRKVEPARPRMGHNNPPEEMAVERQKPKTPPPINLRKRPDEQPEAPAEREPQPRERGRFIARGPEGEYREGVPPQSRQDAQPYVNPLPEHAPYREPPQRMAEHAKAEWHKAPESVRGEIYRMHQNFGRAYQQYRGDYEQMEKLRPFQQMAHKSGVPLDYAFANYVSMEHKLRTDVIGALDLIIDNLNLRANAGTPQERKLGLVDVAWHIVNQTPEQHRLTQSQNRAMAQSHQIQQQQQRIEHLENAQRQAYHREQFTQTRSLVDRYADSGARPRFDELGPIIEREIKLGFNLDQAYKRAELLVPATHAAQTRTATPRAQTPPQAAQTRTDRSISGAPNGGGNSLNGTRPPPRRPGKPPPTVRESIATAMRRVQGH